MLRLCVPTVVVFLSLAMLPVHQAFADCSSLTETSSSLDAATVARVSFDDSCPKPVGLFASITTIDGETIADREIPIGDDLNGTATVDLATWLDPQSRSGVYSIAWRAQLADGSSSTLDQLFTIPCPAPPAVTHRLLPGSNRLIVTVPTGDICQGDTVAILNLLDVLGNAVGDPVTHTFPSAAGQDLSFDLSALEGERRYTGLLSMRNDSGETTESQFTFLTGCGPLQASGALDGPRITGALAASSCHFPVNITVRVLNSDGQEIKTGEAVLNDRDFDLMLPDYEQWAAGEYSVVADFVSSEGRRSSLNLDAQVDCQAPSLSGVSIDSTSNANQAMLLATYQSTDACQGESQINLQLRNSDNIVVFNRTVKQQPSTLPVPLSFPLNAIPGSNYELVATLRYGSLQSEETIVTEKLFFECTEPAILDFGYSKPDASALSALIRLSACNLPAVAKIQVSEPSGRIVASNEVELVESPDGAYSVVPEASIRHLPTGKYSARLVFSDNQSRSLTEELDVDRDVEGPSITFQHQDQLIDENTIPTVSRLENLAVSYSDPSSLLPSSVPYSDQLSSLKVEEAHSVIREISGESGAELWFSGYVELPRTVEDWGFVGVLIEDSQGNRWLAPVTRRFVPVQAENLSGFHPSNHRSGFRSVIRTSSLSPGSYRVVGVMVSIGGRELLAQGQSPFNISSFSTRQTNAILRRGVTERQLTLDFQTTQTAVFSAVSAIPDGTYSLQVTGQDRYGNSSEPRILVFNYKQEKDQRLVNMPAIAGQTVVLKHQFVSTENGRPYDRPVRIVVKRFSGTGAIKVNDRTVDSQIIEFLAAPTTDATFPIKLELVTTDVDAKYVLQPDSPELRPLEVVFTSYEPDFELIREDTPGGETLTVSNRSSSCSRFAVFSNLSELNVSVEETLCALRISHPTSRVTKTTSATTTLEWSASEDLDIPYEIGFVRRLGSNVSFHKLSEHSLAELKSLSLSPILSFEQSSSLKERGRGLVTRTGQFRPGSIVVRAEKPNAIIEINGERPFAPLQVGLHRLPLETNVSSVGDTQRLLVRSFYEPTPAHVAEKAFTFVAVPPPVNVSAVNAQLVAPDPLFIDFRVDAVDSDYKPDLHGGYDVRQALVISRVDTSANPRSVTASLTEAGLIHVALPALDPGSYRIQLTIANADPAVSEHLLPVVSDSSFEVLDGSPIQSHVFTFRSSDSVPFLGHLALDLDDPQRVDDLSTTIWEVSADGKRYQRFQQGPSSIDFALREPSARFFRARLINRHSQSDFVTDPIKVSAYSPTYLSIQGPHQTFRGWPIELRATGVDPGSVVWRVTPPGGDSPEELTAPSITIDPVITGQYFVEAIAKDPAYGADALSSQRVFKTIDVQWAKIPPALISGPTQVELGRAETFKVSHPPIFDGEGNSAIRRVGEWELPNGDVIPDQEWVEFTLEDLPEGDTYANIFYHAWIDGARESTLVTAVHRVKPYSYRWPEWEIHAETISSTLPSVYRLSIRPTQWRQWFDTSDTAIQTSWQLPGQARVRHRTDRELIVEISQDRSFTARVTVTDSRGNVSEIQADDLYPIRTLPFDVAARIVPERSLHTAPIKVEASIEAILLPDDRPVTRVAYYLDEFYAGATDGGPIQLEIRSPGEHRIRAIASVDNEFVAEDTVLFDVSENLPAICNIQPVGDFSLNGVAKAECEDPDGQMVEYRWYLNGQLINATGSRVQLDRRQIQDAAELSLIAIDNAGKEATARYLPEVGG